LSIYFISSQLSALSFRPEKLKNQGKWRLGKKPQKIFLKLVAEGLLIF
jgi:hypothetical protein